MATQSRKPARPAASKKVDKPQTSDARMSRAGYLMSMIKSLRDLSADLATAKTAKAKESVRTKLEGTQSLVDKWVREYVDGE